MTGFGLCGSIIIGSGDRFWLNFSDVWFPHYTFLSQGPRKKTFSKEGPIFDKVKVSNKSSTFYLYVNNKPVEGDFIQLQPIKVVVGGGGSLGGLQWCSGRIFAYCAEIPEII